MPENPNPIVGPVVQAGSGIISSLLANRAAKKTREANKREAELAYQRQVDMFNKQNEYNSPAEQMKRLRAAGLNENLVYGNGATNTTAVSTPKYDAPTQQYVSNVPDLGSALSMYQDFRLKNAQINNVNAQTIATERKSDTELITQMLLRMRPDQINAQTKKLLAETNKVESLLPYQTEVAKAEADRQSSYTALALQRLYNTKATGRNIDQSTELKKQETQYKALQNSLRQMGITESDNYLFRIFARMLGESGLNMPSIEDIGKGIREGITKGYNYLKPKNK